MSPDPRLGTTIGGYRIDSVIGRGGMGTVYLAEHMHLERQVALKVLSDDLAQDEQFRQRFIRESRLAAQLYHPNIIPVHDAGESGGLLFIAMHYVEGTDLKALVDEGALGPARALSILEKVGSALDEAHSKGLIHRDVKPANIMISRPPAEGGREEVFLTDFGLVRRTNSQSQITQAGFFIGTLDYAAPEMFQGKEMDARADVYALTCVLFECLTGHVPFERELDVALIAAHLYEPPPKVTALRPDLPEAVDQVVAAGMAKDPADRYAACGPLMDDARSALEVSRTTPIPGPRPTRAGQTRAGGGLGTVTPPPPVRPAEPRRRRVAVIVAAAVVLAALAIGAVVLLGGGGGTSPNTSVIQVGRDPLSTAFGANVVWVVNKAENTVLPIDARSSTAGDPIHLDNPVAVSFGADAVWVVERHQDQVVRIDPASKAQGAPIDVGKEPIAVAATAGAVWVANLTDGTVSRIDPATNSVVGDPIPVGTKPASIAAFDGPGGDALGVWVVNRGDNTVTRIDPTSNTPGTPLEVAGAFAVAVDPSGVWVTNEFQNTVTRIDPRTEAMKTIPAGKRPEGIAVGAGFVWVADNGGGAVSKIDPRTDTVADSIRVGRFPIALTVGAGAVWVVNSGDRTVTRIGI